MVISVDWIWSLEPLILYPAAENPIEVEKKEMCEYFGWRATISPLLLHWVHDAHQPVQLQRFGGKCVQWAAVFTSAKAPYTHTPSLSVPQKWQEAHSVFSSKHKRLHFDWRDNLLISDPWKSLWRDKRFPLARTGNFDAWKQPSRSAFCQTRLVNLCSKMNGKLPASPLSLHRAFTPIPPHSLQFLHLLFIASNPIQKIQGLGLGLAFDA